MSEQFLETEYFFNFSWRFLIFNELEQLEFKLEKNIGIQKHAEKIRLDVKFSYLSSRANFFQIFVHRLL